MKHNTAILAFGLIGMAAPCWAMQEPAGQVQTAGQTEAVAIPVVTPIITPVTQGSSVTLAEGYTKMSAHERWHGFLHENLLSNGAALRVIGSAAIDHLGSSSSKWGFGALGYFRRFDSRLATIAAEGAIHSSLAALLHEDTRYWRSHDQNAWIRAGHAIKRTFLTYNDSGHRVFDFSNFASMYGGPMLSTCWHPHRNSPLETGLMGGNVAVGAQAAANLFREFGPDIKHIFSKKTKATP